MTEPYGQKGSQPSTLPDPGRRPGRPSYTGLQDPVVIEAARSSSDPASTAAWYVTNGAQRGAACRDGKVGPQGSESVLATRKFNTVLEEMQTRRAKERQEESKCAQGEQGERVPLHQTTRVGLDR